METFFSWLNKLGKDKYMHFSTGAVFYAICRFGFMFFWPGYAHVAVAAFSVVAMVGFLKEYVYDRNVAGHTVDIWDMVATASGGALGWLCGL